MSDLISRSQVNDVIDELEVYTCGRPNTMKVEISVLQLQRFINKLKNIPTAYSVDKVVEELETNKQNALEVEESIKEYNVWNKAIEIVKHVGVSDDVCEWKLDGVYLHSPHKPLVSCVTDENYRYYYCPVCGKKIKVVE